MSDPRLCLALDGCTPTEALTWIHRTRQSFGVYKVGLELFCRGGPDLVNACRKAGASAIFLDLKLHDIPRTVARAVEAAALPGVRWLTVHAAGGRRMLEDAGLAAAGSGVQLLAVTVLTSMDAEEAAETGLPDLLGAVHLRAALAAASGPFGIVCSANEVAEIKAVYPRMFCATPGLRWAGAASHDQRRCGDPASTLAAGSDLLVIGRMVTEAADPLEAVERLVRSLR